jgi:hypothetical protein
MDAATYDDARWVDELGAVAALPPRAGPTPYAPSGRCGNYALATRLPTITWALVIQHELDGLMHGAEKMNHGVVGALTIACSQRVQDRAMEAQCDHARVRRFRRLRRSSALTRATSSSGANGLMR